MSRLLTFTDEARNNLTLKTVEIDGIRENRTPTETPTSILMKNKSIFRITEEYRYVYVMWDDALKRLENEVVKQT